MLGAGDDAAAIGRKEASINDDVDGRIDSFDNGRMVEGDGEKVDVVSAESGATEASICADDFGVELALMEGEVMVLIKAILDKATSALITAGLKSSLDCSGVGTRDSLLTGRFVMAFVVVIVEAGRKVILASGLTAGDTDGTDEIGAEALPSLLLFTTLALPTSTVVDAAPLTTGGMDNF